MRGLFFAARQCRDAGSAAQETSPNFQKKFWNRNQAGALRVLWLIMPRPDIGQRVDGLLARRETMRDRYAEYAKVSEVSILQKHEPDNIKKIEKLEKLNFELRNDVLRLTLHNTALRNMLKLQ